MGRKSKKREVILLRSTAKRPNGKETGCSYSYDRNVQKEKYTGENMIWKFDWVVKERVLFKEYRAKNATN